MNKPPPPPPPPPPPKVISPMSSPAPPPPPPPVKVIESTESSLQTNPVQASTSIEQPRSSACRKTSIKLPAYEAIFDDSTDFAEYDGDEDLAPSSNIEYKQSLDPDNLHECEKDNLDNLDIVKLDVEVVESLADPSTSSEEKSVYFEPLNPAEVKYIVEKQLEDTQIIIINHMKAMASVVYDYQQQCEQQTINDCIDSIDNCKLHKQPVIPHDNDWLDISKAYPAESTWQDLRHVLEVRSSSLLRVNGPTANAKKERDDLLIKIERELSQPRKLSEQKNVEAALHGLSEYFQQGEHLFLHCIAGYDEAVHDFLLKVPAMIKSTQGEVHREFQVTDIIHDEIRVAYQQQVTSHLQAQQLQREHQQTNEALKLKLIKEATMDFALQRQKEVIERNQQNETLDAFRQEQLDLVDETILQSYKGIYQRLQDTSQYIAQENMHERLNTIRYAILLWKQQYAKRLEDRLNSIELVTEGYYITLIEELIEQMMDLRKLHTLGDIYRQKLEAYLSSLEFKDSRKSLPEDDAKALAMLQVFPSKYSSSMIINGQNNKQQPQSPQSILGLGTSLRCLAANAGISSEDTAQLLTYLLISSCQP